MQRRVLSYASAFFCLLALVAPATLGNPYPAGRSLAPAGRTTGLATVTGAVRDGQTGTPLVGAVVVLSPLGRTTATDSTGHYVLSRIPAGSYDIAIRFVGYATRALQVLVPSSGALEINATLRTEPIFLEPIRVSASLPVRGVEDVQGAGFPDRSSSSAAMRNHPLAAEPDALLALGGGEVVLRPETPSGIHVRGGASDQTAYLLDGIPVYSPYHAGGLFSAWNPDVLSRLDLVSSAPSPAYPHFLSGVACAVTRAPGRLLSAQGSVSTTHARATVDGPLGVGRAGYLVSMRTGFPAGLAPRNEESYLRGETGDWLAKLELPAWGGSFRILGYGSENEINTAAGVGVDGATIPVRQRHLFQWHSQSFGAEWSRHGSTRSVRVLGWSAVGGASAAWTSQRAPLDMTAARQDAGLLATLEYGRQEWVTAFGVRVERIGTSYRIEPDSVLAPWGLASHALVAAPFVRHTRQFGARTELAVGASLAAAGRRLHPGPRAQLRWRPSRTLSLSGTYARLHQFAQSLRNPESIAGNVFPADLYIGAGAPGIPVAQSDQGVIAATFEPTARVRFGAQLYARTFDRLLLVAPSVGAPFATWAPNVGSGTSRGVSVDVAVSASRLGLLGSYGFQRLRFDSETATYVPDYGARHLVEGGVIFFPGSAWSFRFGVAGALGRRTTPLAGALEWEAPNLLDRGSEFGGSPHYDVSGLGGTALPPYLRADVGVRRTWRFGVGARQASVALFGTITNALGRRNVLTYAADPASGKPVVIEMRPLSPLVVGLDWRF